MSNSNDLIVSVSGIRGITGQGLTAEVVARFAAAYGSFCGGKTVLVSRDGRPSGEMLRHAAIAGLLSAGCSVQDIGIAPTPTCGFAVRHLRAAGAIQITASHNPAPWNGLKMFGADGAVLSAADGAVVRGLFESGDIRRAAWDGIGTLAAPPHVHEEHAKQALDQISVAAVAACGFPVFLDANGGSGGPLGTKLLRDLGCQVCEHECQPTGLFTHEPEPTPAHLVDVAPWVHRNGCAVGFVLDPDADRLALIDETGTCISEEATLALAVKYRLKHERGPVVVNMSTSRMSEDLAHAAGCPFHRSAVGEANVVSLLREAGAVIGGEGNGGVIDPRVGWVRDPFIGMCLILSLMAEEGKPLSELVAELPRYAMKKAKFDVPREKLPAALAALEARWPDATRNRIDGLRLDGPDWWLHVRGSNTEPVVRAIAEAPSEDRVNALVAEAAVAFPADAGYDASMMRMLVLLLVAGVVPLATAVQPAVAPAPRPITEREAFFRSGKVLNLSLEFDKKAADSLRRDYRTYVKCKLRDGDKVYEDVGVHLKGAAGSLRGFDDKPGLTLNMDKFNDGARYRGMDKFHLSNSVQDGSYLSELLCGEIFRAAGVPAARVGFALVTIDGRKRGFYYLKEGYDREFLKTHFGNADGNFYDGGFLRDIDQPLQLVSTKKDVADRKDLQALLAAAREPDAKKRFERLEKLLDMDSFISYMVVEAITWDWDGYPFKCNNYRIYHDPKKDKITFIPSGMDQMFWDVGGPALPGFGGSVAAAIVNTPEGKKRYYARMREILRDVYKPEQLVTRLDELEKIVQPALASVDQGAGNDYKNQVNRLRYAVRERAKSLEQQMKQIKD